MKKKPILLSKVLANRKSITRKVIGLIGAHQGAGVTYTGIMLAFYMAEEMGRKTALLECNNSHDLDLFENAYEWSSEDTSTYSFGGITCFKSVSDYQIAEILSENYDCIILDFGSDLMRNREEFLRCTTKLVIGGHAWWNRQKTIRFIGTIKSIRGNDTWHYLIPFAGRRELSSMKKELGRPFNAVPYETDPTRLSKETINLFHRLVG
ncbi:MAG TPA: hypothetical protein VJ888_04815 [Mobilitalea sp.]|nr:hypothetical protein [Mobilitalea sp.]